MWSDRVSNSESLALEPDALPTALHGPATEKLKNPSANLWLHYLAHRFGRRLKSQGDLDLLLTTVCR